MGMKILVTGTAGFIGNALAIALMDRGDEVVGIDNLTPYYDISLKQARLDRIIDAPAYTHEPIDLGERIAVDRIFRTHKPDAVVHLAAQPGVRYSLENPHSYLDSNVYGLLNILEGCRHHGVRHLVTASSSSVYGANQKSPSSVHDNVDHPVSLYAATKKTGELMAHTYSHLFDIPITCLRYFTVYGPWGRPDMAPYLFTRAISEGKPINVFNNGDMSRDFTYVDDIVQGTVLALDHVPAPLPVPEDKELDCASSPVAPYRLYNIGNGQPSSLMRFIEILEAKLGKVAEKNFMPMQPGDVKKTFADITDLARDTGYAPATSLEEGVSRFVDWYREYHGTT